MYKKKMGQTQWLTPVILAIPEAEIGSMKVREQRRRNVWETTSQPTKAGHGGTQL
jgi:hypothetical protein